MEPRVGQLFKLNGRLKNINGGRITYENRVTRKMEYATADNFVMKFYGTTFPDNHLIFCVLEKSYATAVNWEHFPQIAIHHDVWTDNYGDIYVDYETVLEPARDARFPHQCTSCGQDAYIGGMNNCECSNSNCQLYYNKKRY